ncbi:MAG: hypothetical protein ABSB59_22800 [Streptosporangiaceae bacterium]|jgi:hypothetical protein
MAATPAGHRRPVSQLSTREVDLYGNQFERCLKALSTDAPIRADVQRELAAVHALRQSRIQASQPPRPCRPRDVSGLAAGELERTRRELTANLGLARPDSPARAPILAHISAIDTELARRTDQQS